MAMYIISALTVIVLIGAPILAGLALARSQIAGTYRRMEENRIKQFRDLEYLDSKPQDYMKPALIVEKDKRILKLNTTSARPYPSDINQSIKGENIG